MYQPKLQPSTAPPYLRAMRAQGEADKAAKEAARAAAISNSIQKQYVLLGKRKRAKARRKAAQAAQPSPQITVAKPR